MLRSLRLHRVLPWLRKNPLLVVTLCAALVSAIGFALSRPVLLVNDGDAYMEMARSAGHGRLEVNNGLDIVQSPELMLDHSVQRGAHLYPKYPPLYGVLAALPFLALGIRGMYLLDAIALALTVPGFYLLARRMLTPDRALVAALLLPVAVPLAPYLLIELPHLLSLALVVWATVFWDRSRRAASPASAGWLGLASGVLLGFAFGVRLQNFVLLPPLVGVGFIYARHAWRLVVGLGIGFMACAMAIALCNVERFGTLNPFSYGPAMPQETVAYFLRVAFASVTVLLVGALVAARWLRRPRWAACAGAVSLLVIIGVAPLRHQAAAMIATTGSFLVNASIAGAGWSTPDYTHDWMNKALLVSAPFLVLGLLGTLACCARRAPPLPTALAWMVVALVIFLSAREADSRGGSGAMGFISLNPRYLVEIMPALYLLGWRMLRRLRVGPGYVAVGVVVCGALLARFATDPNDFAPYKITLLTDGSIALATMTLAAYMARRRTLGAIVLATAVVLTHGYAVASAVGEDCMAFSRMAAIFQVWGQRVLAATPETAALVGWRFGLDPIFFMRAERTIITVNASRDDAASLAPTLDAIVATGTTPFFFGFGHEFEDIIRPRLAGRYRVVTVLSDPPLWRLDRESAAP